MDKISVIIPVYKSEKYICKCVDSILAQTHTNIEILLVDDGSPDNCPYICDKLALKDNRIKVIHKENGGVSSARNMGIECAEGKYITFVDSDDTLNPCSLESLYTRIKETSAHMAAGSIAWIMPKKTDYHILNNEFVDEYSIVPGLIKYVKQFDGSVWGKLYKKSIIDENKIRFTNGIPMGEDTQFLIAYMGYCKGICMTDDIVYNYDLSVVGSAIKKYYEDYDLYMFTLFETMSIVIKKSHLTKEEKELYVSAAADKFCCDSVRYYIENITNTKEVIKRIKRILKKYRGIITAEAFELSDIKALTVNQFEYLINGDEIGFIKKWKKDLLNRGFVTYCKFNIKLLLKKLR